MMRKDWLPVAALATALLIDVPVNAEGLAGFQWESRLVLSFSSVSDDGKARQQRENQNSAWPEWSERHLVLVEIDGSNDVWIDGVLNPAMSGAALRKGYDVPESEFAAVLVGKDGGEKWRGDRALPNPELFRIIDAMPMRQDEMRGN